MDIKSEEKPIEIRGHHLVSLNDYVKAFYDSNYAKYLYIAPEYGIEFALNAGDIYRKIFTDDKQKVKIVADFDDFCRKCPKKKECENDYSLEETENFDARFTEAAGLEIGKVYNSKEVLDALERSEKFKHLAIKHRNRTYKLTVDLNNFLKNSICLLSVGKEKLAEQYYNQLFDIFFDFRYRCLEFEECNEKIKQLFRNYKNDILKACGEMTDEELKKAILLEKVFDIFDLIFPFSKEERVISIPRIGILKWI